MANILWFCALLAKHSYSLLSALSSEDNHTGRPNPNYSSGQTKQSIAMLAAVEQPLCRRRIIGQHQ
eukprot:scaffold166160_cov35-Prasinocladus_malaysianus.AAC.1